MRSKLNFIFFIFVLSYPQLSRAEFLCRGEVTYKWIKNPPPAEKTIPVVGATSSPPPEITPVEIPPLNVFWTSIEQKGATEDDGKAQVTKLSLQERASAEKTCVSQHENLSGCIASKFDSLSSTLATLSFSARKAMEEAISKDCSGQLGKCQGSALSEIKCVEVIATPAAGDAGKDGKDKKDPKKK